MILLTLHTFERVLVFVERRACRRSPDVRFDVSGVQSDGQITVGLGHSEPAAHKHSHQDRSTRTHSCETTGDAVLVQSEEAGRSVGGQDRAGRVRVHSSGVTLDGAVVPAVPEELVPLNINIMFGLVQFIRRRWSLSKTK